MPTAKAPAKRTRKAPAKPKAKVSKLRRPAKTVLTLNHYKRDFESRVKIHNYEVNALIQDITKGFELLKPYYTATVKRIREIEISWETGTSTPPRGAFFMYINNMRNIQLTETEETALVQMAMFFTDLGTPDEIDSEAFESLTDKIFDPSPFDYSWALCRMKWSLRISLTKPLPN